MVVPSQLNSRLRSPERGLGSSRRPGGPDREPRLPGLSGLESTAGVVTGRQRSNVHAKTWVEGRGNAQPHTPLRGILPLQGCEEAGPWSFLYLLAPRPPQNAIRSYRSFQGGLGPQPRPRPREQVSPESARPRAHSSLSNELRTPGRRGRCDGILVISVLIDTLQSELMSAKRDFKGPQPNRLRRPRFHYEVTTSGSSRWIAEI